jgi:hypothetical protein
MWIYIIVILCFLAAVLTWRLVISKRGRGKKGGLNPRQTRLRDAQRSQTRHTEPVHEERRNLPYETFLQENDIVDEEDVTEVRVRDDILVVLYVDGLENVDTCLQKLKESEVAVYMYEVPSRDSYNVFKIAEEFKKAGIVKRHFWNTCGYGAVEKRLNIRHPYPRVVVLPVSPQPHLRDPMSLEEFMGYSGFPVRQHDIEKVFEVFSCDWFCTLSGEVPYILGPQNTLDPQDTLGPPNVQHYDMEDIVQSLDHEGYDDYHSDSKPVYVENATGWEECLFQHRGHVVVKEHPHAHEWGWITGHRLQKIPVPVVDIVMDIHVLCCNEAHIIPLFLRHYWWARKIYVYYDDSTEDESATLLESDKRVRIIQFHAENHRELYNEAKRIREEGWKVSRDADWVMVLDMDELWYHPCLLEYLHECMESGITVLRPMGYQIILTRSPLPDIPIQFQARRGVRSPPHDKPSMFRPRYITQMNFMDGCHNAHPTGRVKFNEPGALKMLHMKHAFDMDLEIKVNARLRKRFNYSHRLYNFDEQRFIQCKEAFINMSYDVFNRHDTFVV